MVEQLFGKENVVKDKTIPDKESLEQKEEERKNIAQKDRVSFSFSWVAIVIRGIVGTVISIFVFTQANRIEDENTMSRLMLIYDYHQRIIKKDFNSLLIEIQNLSQLKKDLPSLSNEEINKFLEPFLKLNKYIHVINLNPISNLDPQILDSLKKENLYVSFDIQENEQAALKGTTINVYTPVRNDKKIIDNYIFASLDLKKLLDHNIDLNHAHASDIYVYTRKPKNGNELLYFYNAKSDFQEKPPAKMDDLKLNHFSLQHSVKIGNEELIFIYQATPEFTAHTWQATIAAGIGIAITTFIVVTAWILLEIEKRQFSNVLHEGHIQEIEGTIDLLETTKNRLVAQENLASLGGLTAGIAHEIKNPLNFINNFSTLSIDIVNEISNFLARYKNIGTPEERAEIYESLSTLKQNIDTIHEQGKRADSTIQRMLAHSRGKSGEWILTDIHKILDEYITFSYHGMRAKNSNFQVKIEKKFDSTVKEIEVVTNDISRVFLNLLNNAFQAIDEKEKKMGKEFQNPTVTIKTENVGNYLRIRIRDNGIGISNEDKSKIFTPFFTTKPTGVGTGLGLSLSYNIIVREHGGSLTFESKQNEFTEFIITIPLHPKKVSEGNT